jgi:hypothetical protein
MRYFVTLVPRFMVIAPMRVMEARRLLAWTS